MKAKDADTIKIGGDYQHKALTQGFRAQRFWHHTKMLAIGRHLPAASGDIIFDVGCGSGVVADFLGRSGAQVTGIDGNPDAIAYARNHFARPNVSFVEGHVDHSLPTTTPVDKIYCLEVIEHIYRNQAVDMLRAFHRALRNGGEVFLTTPNYRSMWPVIEWMLDHSGLVPVMAEHQHVEFYHRGKLSALFKECGFEVRMIISVSLLSPWTAIASWRLAEQVLRLESRLPFCIGPVLVAVARKA